MTETAPSTSSHGLTPAEEPSTEPVFGGLTEALLLAAVGVLVGAAVGGTGVGVAVFGAAVGVDVGVCVFNFR